MRASVWATLPVAMLLAGWPMPGVGASREQSARMAAAQAEQCAARGAWEQAVDAGKSARDLFRKARREPELIDALTQLGAAYHALGQQRLAGEALEEAVVRARAAQDRPRTAAALSRLGAMQTFSRTPEVAEKNLREALQLARTPAVLNNLGNLTAAQGNVGQALQTYREALALAGDPELAATVRANLADAISRSGAYDEAARENAAALRAAAALDGSHEKAFCQLRAGKTWEHIFEGEPAHDPQRRVAALRAYEEAARTATAIGDDRALSFALGYAGHLYEQEQKWDDALLLTTRATFLAQRLRSPDLLYQWAWQTGRIARAQGRLDEAIDCCRRSVELLETIRSDLSVRLTNVNARSSYREAVGGVYFELADLLLLRADGVGEKQALEGVLKEAREVCEQLKSVELEDYFQDDCVNLLQQKKRSVENVLRDGLGQTAVIYFIPLRDRTETLVSLPDGLRRVKAAVGAEELTATVRDFRRHLEKRTTQEYLAEAGQLYDWLIRPLEALFAAGKIDTLVFVPDGALRTVPMAAFHDREKFLIEKYAIAVTPGLTLMEPRRMAGGNPAIMSSGLSEAVQGYAALPFVAAELQQLGERFHGRTLLNRDFLASNVRKEFKQQDYSVVHIASHGEFNGDVHKTFVLTYDARFSLEDLERLITPAKLRDKPVEMLALSACQTAAGDDRAALGLAGVAVKAGARSAFATLWFVNDEASTTLISEFYTTLFAAPRPSKAQALRTAQLKLLADPRYAHPCLWAPYLIIGNWL